MEKYRYSHNYIWLDENTLCELNERIKRANEPKKTSSKIVIQIDKETGEVMRTYDSVTEACKMNSGYKQLNIAGCCRGEQHTAYGYKWKYKEE